MAHWEKACKWRSEGIKAEDGILVGAEISQEWLLPWWWENYRKYNSFAVAFADFGMSESMRSWCRERGEVIPLKIPDLFVLGREELDPLLAAEWIGGGAEKFWDIRTVWFKKPFAFLQTPFQRTIWIDVDCEIRSSLGALFACCDDRSGLGMVRYGDEPMYNSGVVPFKRGIRLLEDWARESLRRNHLFCGDQELLTALILEQKLPLCELSPTWNWSREWGDRDDAEIFHWHGDVGKMVIYTKIKHL